jgi:hypothetical protein
LPRFRQVLLIGLIVLLLLSLVADRVFGQQGITVISEEAQNDFPTGVTFDISFDAPGGFEEARLRYELAPDGTGASAVAECTAAAVVSCTHTLTSGRGIFIIPGAEITYFWEVDNGDVRTTTEPRLYVHEDTRFDFDTLTQGIVTVYYHSGTQGLAPQVLAAALETLDEIGRLTGGVVDFPVKVFLYETAQEMQPAIAGGGGDGVLVLGEVTYSDTAMVSASNAPLDITRHEIAHIVTGQAVAGPFGIPRWLNEGISVYAQSQVLPNQASALESAIRNDSVLTMRQLNSPSLSGTAGTVSLFYAQSGAIVSFLVDEYGEEPFAHLMRVFRDGARPDNAFMEVYGVDEAGLEDAWRASVGLPPRPTPTPPGQAVVDETPDDPSGGEAPGLTPAGGDTNRVELGIIAGLGFLLVVVAAGSLHVVRQRL